MCSPTLKWRRMFEQYAAVRKLADLLLRQGTLARLRLVDMPHRRRQDRICRDEAASPCVVQRPLQQPANLARCRIEPVILLAPYARPYVLGGDIAHRLMADEGEDAFVQIPARGGSLLAVTRLNLTVETLGELGQMESPAATTLARCFCSTDDVLIAASYAASSRFFRAFFSVRSRYFPSVSFSSVPFRRYG